MKFLINRRSLIERCNLEFLRKINFPTSEVLINANGSNFLNYAPSKSYMEIYSLLHFIYVVVP